MTGPFGRFRAWVGSLFGTREETADGEAANAETSDPPSSGSAEVTAELLEQAIAEAESTPTTETVRRERAGDAADAEDSPFELEGGPKTVRVSSDEGGADEETAGDEDAPEGAETTDATETEAVDGDADATPTDYAYRCTVCGTGVETPDDPCPLCHASEIVPTDDAGDVYDEADDSPEASGPIGETTTSISDADDAVERLRDLRNDGG